MEKQQDTLTRENNSSKIENTGAQSLQTSNSTAQSLQKEKTNVNLNWLGNISQMKTASGSSSGSSSGSGFLSRGRSGGRGSSLRSGSGADRGLGSGKSVQWTEVAHKKKWEDTAKTKQFHSGLMLTKIGPKKAASLHPAELTAVVEAIMEVDPEAFILNYKNQDASAIPASKISSVFNFDKQWDIQVLEWGAKTEDKWRTGMSFWLASDIIGNKLLELKQNNSIARIMAEIGLTLTAHNLHQTDSKQVGFLRGKDPRHTWREGITTRIQEAIQHETNMPIQVQIKATTVRGKDKQGWALVMFVGTKDLTKVKKALEKFDEIKIVPASMKQTSKKLYDREIDLHNSIVENSRAIRVMGITEDGVYMLRSTFSSDASMKGKVIDVFEASTYDKDGKVYVQHVSQSHQEVADLLKETLDSWNEAGDSSCPRGAYIGTYTKDSQTQYTQETTEAPAYDPF